MSYKISDEFIRKIKAPVSCDIEGVKKEYTSGALLSETAFDKAYEVKEILCEGEKIVLSLTEIPAQITKVNEPYNWIGENPVMQGE